MIKNIKKHFGYYLVFWLLQALGGILIVLASGNKPLQLIGIFAETMFYFIFAIVHQMINHELNAKIVVEYALIGCLGLAFSLVLFR